jgi:hypothetical protein
MDRDIDNATSERSATSGESRTTRQTTPSDIIGKRTDRPFAQKLGARGPIGQYNLARSVVHCADLRWPAHPTSPWRR